MNDILDPAAGAEGPHPHGRRAAPGLRGGPARRLDRGGGGDRPADRRHPRHDLESNVRRYADLGPSGSGRTGDGADHGQPWQPARRPCAAGPLCAGVDHEGLHGGRGPRRRRGHAADHVSRPAAAGVGRVRGRTASRSASTTCARSSPRYGPCRPRSRCRATSSSRTSVSSWGPSDSWSTPIASASARHAPSARAGGPCRSPPAT